ncbi:MAG: tyrosine-type recombinase/integrase, partial [Planctomycetota bacterium]
MATEKVGTYRKYHGAVPVDKSGTPLPKSEWPRLRPFSWAVRWFGSDGKRFSRSFKSRKEAERYAETKQAEVRVGKGDRPRSVTLAEFATMYLNLRGDLAATTKAEHERTLRFSGEFLGRQMIVSKVTPLDARRFVAWYRKREYRGRTPAPATVNRIVRECKRIFREAVTCSLIRDNPFHELRQEKIGQRPWHYIRITLGYLCGLRLGEVLNLTWPDVDFERNEIRIVRKSATECRSPWMPKDKEMRVLPLPDQAVSVLVGLQVTAADGQEYVLVTHKGPAAGERMKQHNVWRDFQAIRGKADLPK